MSRHLVIRWVFPTLLLAVVGVGAFWGVTTLRGQDDRATADPRPDFWYVPYFEDDAQKPRFDQEINGILVGPSPSDLTSELCGEPGANPEYVPLEMVKGTVLDFRPAYLPEGVTTAATEVVSCAETVVSVVTRFNVASRPNEDDPSVPLWAGGEITISRFLTSSRSLSLDDAAERIEGTTILGRAAVLAKPVIRDGIDIGIGDATVAVTEDFGMTVVSGRGLPLDEFMKFVEGVYGGASS